ncbi:hypothetical protein DFR33_101619 [Bradymonas sediminis]|nr:hypothetical protein DFR33_101619 [Bradymonas sediminis]
MQGESGVGLIVWGDFTIALRVRGLPTLRSGHRAATRPMLRMVVGRWIAASQHPNHSIAHINPLR